MAYVKINGWTFLKSIKNELEESCWVIGKNCINWKWFWLCGTKQFTTINIGPCPIEAKLHCESPKLSTRTNKEKWPSKKWRRNRLRVQTSRDHRACVWFASILWIFGEIDTNTAVASVMFVWRQNQNWVKWTSNQREITSETYSKIVAIGKIYIIRLADKIRTLQKVMLIKNRSMY